MKKSEELIGMLVMSIEEGKQVGKIREVILNPHKAEIMGLAIEDERWYQEVKVVTFANIHSLGDDAVIIENTSAVIGLSNMPDVIELLDKNIHIKGNKVYTKKGKLIGQVIEFYINPMSGEISGYEISPTSLDIESRILPARCVLTIGKDALIVDNDVENYLLKDISELEELSEVKKIETIPVIPKIEEVVEKKAPPVTEVKEIVPELKKEEVKKEEVKLPPPKEETTKKTDLTKVFEERQKKFMMGKKTTRKIETAEGILIANTGEIVTEEIIDKAKAAGKFMELSMSISMEG